MHYLVDPLYTSVLALSDVVVCAEAIAEMTSAS